MRAKHHLPVIALVEDTPEIADVTAEVLTMSGYTVRHYSRYAEVARDMAAHRPDIVLLDGGNPARYDGWEAAAELQTQGCAVVMFTAHHLAAREIGVTPRGCAFAGALLKPFDIDALLDTLAVVWQTRAIMCTV